MPLLVGLALLSMAAGARYGHPAPVTAASAKASAAARIVTADRTAADAPLPAGFAASVDGVRGTTADGIHADGGTDRWRAYGAVPPAVVSIPASPAREQSPAASPSALRRTTLPAALSSRAPPIA